MPEEIQDPDDDNLDEVEQAADETTDPALDQNSIDAMVQNAQGSQADELESLLEDLGEDEESGADQLEDLVESLEDEPEEENLGDLLSQATQQDVENTEPDAGEASAEAAPEADAKETTEEELNKLDALAAAFDDDEPAEEIESTDDAPAEDEDLSSLRSGLDGPGDAPEESTTVSDAEGDEAIVDESEQDESAGETAEEIEDVESLLEDLDGTEDIAEAEEEVEDVESLLEDLDETAADEAPEAEEEVENVESLLEDLDETAADEAPEAEEEVENVESLLEDLDEATEADTAEAEEEVEDVESLLEDLDETAEADTAEAEEDIDDLESLLEDIDDTAQDAEETLELEDLTDEAEEESLLEEVGESEEAGAEAEEELDVESLLDDIDDEEAGEPEPLEDQESIDALVESEAEDIEPSADTDSLLEDLDEDVDSLELLEETEVEETLDLDELLVDDEETTDDQATEAALVDDVELTDLDDLDLDDLDLDDDSLPELDLDDDEPDAIEDLEEDSDELETAIDALDADLESSAEDDLDSLFDDDTLLDDSDEIAANLSVGVEHEVAHMLATGQPAPTEEGEDLFEDFASVQASFVDESAMDSGGTILIVDDDEDNIGLFQDALVEGDYEFVTTASADEALNTLQSRDIDLVLVNLDTGDSEGVNAVQRIYLDDVPPVPVVVTSEQGDLIEEALMTGATDHFTRPIGIVDLEYQVPRTVSNLIKLKRTQHVLAGAEAGASTESTSPSSTDTFGDLLDDDDGLDDFLLDDDDDPFSDDDPLDEDDLPATAHLAAGTGSSRDRLAPLTDQGKMVREKEWSRNRKSAASNLPMYLGIGLLLLVLSGVSAMVTMLLIDMRAAEMAEKEPIQRPQPLPVLKPPKIQQAGYEISRARVRQSDDYQRQAESVKGRIRNTVRELETQGGSWWSPWRVMRNAGGSVAAIVQGRSANDIREAFGVDRSTVRAGLQSQRSLNYLRGVGYDLSGKDVDDLSSRETFELLSAREIKSQDQIVNVLSRLTDRLAQEKAEQAKNRSSKRKRQGTASLAPSRPEPVDHFSRATSKVEQPEIIRKATLPTPELAGFAIRIPGIRQTSESG